MPCSLFSFPRQLAPTPFPFLRSFHVRAKVRVFLSTVFDTKSLGMEIHGIEIHGELAELTTFKH